MAQLEYVNAIGSLMYAMHCTRPDIAFSICKLSRYTSKPNTDHCTAIARVWLSKKNNQFGLVLFWFSSCDGRI